jgi:glycosyltransferase involved in cell wall biosynthesis
LAAEYNREFGANPIVLLNAPFAEPLNPSTIDPNRIRLIHHGIAKPGRKLERLIDAAATLDRRFELNLMLRGKSRHINDLKRHASGLRVKFPPPVPQDEICRTINQYDIGLISYVPTTFNLRHCLPNKFFEFIQARLALIVSPLPDMASIVEEQGIGIVTNGFTVKALADSIDAIEPEELIAHKRASGKAADKFCWDEQGGLLAGVVRRALAPFNECAS